MPTATISIVPLDAGRPGAVANQQKEAQLTIELSKEKSRNSNKTPVAGADKSRWRPSRIKP